MKSRATYPIVLAHGIARFDAGWSKLFELDNRDDPVLDQLHYFRGIRTMLVKNGFTVFHSSVAWAARVDERAEQLRKNVCDVLERTRAAKVNIIAHSMGGLDARHMLFNDRRRGRIHEKVASLTTIGTPHRGTSLADVGIQEHGPLIETLKRLRLDIEGFRDLTRPACAAFNDDVQVRAFEDEFQQRATLIACAGSASADDVLSLLRKPYEIIRHEEGDNDGLVAVESALWTRAQHTEIWENTDHLNQLAWWDFSQAQTEGLFALTNRIHDKYLQLARRLPAANP